MKPLKKKFRATHQSAQARADYPELLAIAQHCWETKNLSVSPLKQVNLKLSQGGSSIWLGVKQGTLPPPISITGTLSKRWLDNELNAIIAARTFESRTGLPVDMVAFVSLLISGAKNSATRGPRQTGINI